jgi:3-hydroxybutyryl-CoA dehydrogenase
MHTTPIHKIVVCGAGTMGSGIAETAARSGYKTLLYDPAPQGLDKARQRVIKNLAMLEEKEKITTEEKDKALGLLTFSGDVRDCRADLVIEAIVENMEIKKKLFADLATINSVQTILASNTSSLSVTVLAENTSHPERMCGMHFFNPAQLMKLVEVVETNWTNTETLEAVKTVVGSMGKIAVVCKDSPGFIVNRVARHYYLEALRLLEQGVSDIETIDRIMENAGFRMGPFRLMDLIGNDVNLAVTRSLYESCGKPERFKPSAIQEEKVDKGQLGRKSGQGYYTY